ncbi:MAG: protein kinase [Verrucomicrobiales bacterium]|nr:protein kinase [Verrucomicrobiales bacterium]
MGVVHEAIDTFQGFRVLALKALDDQALVKPGVAERFVREITAVRKLEHAHILQICDSGTAGKTPYFTMPLMNSGSLADHLVSGGFILPGAETSPTDRRVVSRRIARLTARLARALHYAHTKDVVHRDLKPSNVLFHLPDGAMTDDADALEPYLSDFGLAKLLDSPFPKTTEDVRLGTPEYMSPEQARGNSAAVTAETDVHGLGVVLFEMLTGRLPFIAPSLTELLSKIVSQEAPSPRSVNPCIDRNLNTICLKCLRKNPGDRYRTAAKLAEDLESWLAGSPISARPLGWLERVAMWAKRRPAVAGLIIALLLGGLGTTTSALRIRHLRASAALGLERRAMQKAEEHFAQGRSDWGFALLSRTLREFPQSRVAAERLANQLRLATLIVPVPPSLSDGSRPGTIALAETPACVLSGIGSNAIHVEIYSSQALSTTNLDAHRGIIRDLQLSHGGTRFVSASADRTAKIWSCPSGELKHILLHPDTVLVATFSPDDSQIATACQDGAIRLWDSTTGKAIAPALPHTSIVKKIAFEPKGRYLLALTDASEMLLWRTNGARLSDPIVLPQEAVDAYFHRDDLPPRIIVDDEHGRIGEFLVLPEQVFEPPDANPPVLIPLSIARPSQDIMRRYQERHSAEIGAMDSNQVASLVATASDDGTVLIWESHRSEPIASLRLPFAVSAVRFDSQGIRLMTASGREHRVWDAVTGHPLTPVIALGDEEDAGAQIGFSVDGSKAFIWSHDGAASGSIPLSRFSESVPVWLADFAESLAGCRAADFTGGFERIPLTERTNALKALQNYAPNDALAVELLRRVALASSPTSR